MAFDHYLPAEKGGRGIIISEGTLADKKRKMVDNAEEEKRKCSKEGGGVFSSSFLELNGFNWPSGGQRRQQPTGGWSATVRISQGKQLKKVDF